MTTHERMRMTRVRLQMTCRHHITREKIGGGENREKKVGGATVKYYFWHKSKKSKGTVIREKSRGGNIFIYFSYLMLLWCHALEYSTS